MNGQSSKVVSHKTSRPITASYANQMQVPTSQIIQSKLIASQVSAAANKRKSGSGVEFQSRNMQQSMLSHNQTAGGYTHDDYLRRVEYQNTEGQYTSTALNDLAKSKLPQFNFFGRD